MVIATYLEEGYIYSVHECGCIESIDEAYEGFYDCVQCDLHSSF